ALGPHRGWAHQRNATIGDRDFDRSAVGVVTDRGTRSAKAGTLGILNAPETRKRFGNLVRSHVRLLRGHWLFSKFRVACLITTSLRTSTVTQSGPWLFTYQFGRNSRAFDITVTNPNDRVLLPKTQ